MNMHVAAACTFLMIFSAGCSLSGGFLPGTFSTDPEIDREQARPYRWLSTELGLRRLDRGWQQGHLYRYVFENHQGNFRLVLTAELDKEAGRQLLTFEFPRSCGHASIATYRVDLTAEESLVLQNALASFWDLPRRSEAAPPSDVTPMTIGFLEAYDGTDYLFVDYVNASGRWPSEIMAASFGGWDDMTRLILGTNCSGVVKAWQSNPRVQLTDPRGTPLAGQGSRRKARS